jgi:uncharacterized protein (TIGR00369 family)
MISRRPRKVKIAAPVDNGVMHPSPPLTMELDQKFVAVRRRHHPDCVVCGSRNARGLQLAFTRQADGSVSASFACDPAWTGYSGCLHGGVIAALLDGASTNCLFAHGHAALTAELIVRYREPVATGRPAVVRARLVESTRHLHYLQAELEQDGRVKATAKARFIPRPTASEVNPDGKEIVL